MNHSMREMHDLLHKSLPCLTNTIQLWKYCFKSTIPTPYILPKLHISTITHIGASYQRNLGKVKQPLLIDFHTLTPYVPDTGFVHQPPQPFPYFTSMTLLQMTFLSVPYLHNHLPSKAELNLLK